MRFDRKKIRQLISPWQEKGLSRMVKGSGKKATKEAACKSVKLSIKEPMAWPGPDSISTFSPH